MKLGVLCRLRQFFSPYQLLTLYRGLIRPCMEYASQVWGGSTHTALLNRVESKAFRLINSPPLTDCLQSLKHWAQSVPFSPVASVWWLFNASHTQSFIRYIEFYCCVPFSTGCCHHHDGDAFPQLMTRKITSISYINVKVDTTTYMY